MTALIGSIMARLQADASGLAAGLNLGASKVTLYERHVRQSLDRVDKRWTKVAGAVGVQAMALAGRGAILLGSFVSVGAAIEGAKRALEDFGNTADNAKAAGLDSEFWQSLVYQAGLGGVAVDQVSAALTTFNRNSGLAEAGTGRMATALAKLNPELLKNIQNATSQEQRVRLAADAIAAAGTSADKAALSVALFGDSGAKLVDVFADGARSIDATMAKAKALGLIVDRDLIARADELGDELDTATKVMDLQFKQALVDLAPLLVGTAQFVGALASAVRGLASEFTALENRSTSALEGRLTQIKELLATAGTDVTLPSGEIVPANPMAVSIGGADVTALEQEKNLIEGILAARKSIAELPSTTIESTGERNSAAAAAIAEGQAVKDLIADLQAERDAIGKSAVEQRVATELRKAGVAATAEQKAQIVALVQTIESETAALDLLKKQFETAEGYAKSFASSLVSDLSKGTSVAESLSNAFASLGEQLLQMAADQAISALFSNLLGSAIGGGFTPFGGSTISPRTGLPPLFAGGGFTGVGGKYEPAGVVHRGEFVFDAASTRRIGVPNLERIRGFANGGFVGGPAGSSPLPANENEAPIVISPTYSIDARGSSVTKAEIRAMLEANNNKLARDLPQMLADARRRGAA